jgi:hypothetical protein
MAGADTLGSRRICLESSLWRACFTGPPFGENVTAFLIIIRPKAAEYKPVAKKGLPGKAKGLRKTKGHRRVQKEGYVVSLR